MALFKRPSPVLATVHRRPLRCRICDCAQFWQREVKLNTTGAEFFGAEWMNESATGLVCASCGFVHEFVGDAVEVWIPEGGYPPEPAGDARTRS